MEKVVFQSSKVLPISYCHFVFHTKLPLAEAISHCSPGSLIVGMLLAAAHTVNFSIALKQGMVWVLVWFFFLVVAAVLVCGSWFLWISGVFLIGTAFDWCFKVLCQLIP